MSEKCSFCDKCLTFKGIVTIGSILMFVFSIGLLGIGSISIGQVSEGQRGSRELALFLAAAVLGACTSILCWIRRYHVEDSPQYERVYELDRQ